MRGEVVDRDGRAYSAQAHRVPLTDRAAVERARPVPGQLLQRGAQGWLEEQRPAGERRSIREEDRRHAGIGCEERGPLFQRAAP